MSTSSSPSAPSLLVGRERELGILRNHLTAALAGQGGLVLIGGEAGIGKTVLAEALCREATEQGTLVLTGRCYDLTETPPYGPWIDLFARYQPSPSSLALPDSFAAVADTIGGLPESANRYREWWSNHAGNPQARGWMDAGFTVETLDLNGQGVTFRRVTPRQG